MSIYQDSLNIVFQVACVAPPLVLAVTIHEAAHGFIAYLLGDDTAKASGRMTLNPLKHIDPIGTILVPIALFISIFALSSAQSKIIFGWAKPVPVTQNRLKNPKRDFALVSAAGPLSNIIMAMIWGIIFILTLPSIPSLDDFLTKTLRELSTTTSWLALMSSAGIWMNIILAAINLLPIPPLDGSNIIAAFLSKRAHALYMSLAPIGVWLVLALLISGALTNFIWLLATNMFYLVHLIAAKVVSLIELIPAV